MSEQIFVKLFFMVEPSCIQLLWYEQGEGRGRLKMKGGEGGLRKRVKEGDRVRGIKGWGGGGGGWQK